MRVLFLGALFGLIVGSAYGSIGIAVGVGVVGMTIGLFVHGVAWAHRFNQDDEGGDRRRRGAIERRGSQLGKLGHAH